ncbi:MAG: DUF5681 domain-containing protein [Gammaproteobacteria bacterium]|nr:DUF5681 domain-containing protein [Gammaproteobacteria bacterium]
MSDVDTPEWLKAHREANTSSAGQRGWLPGQSGNPKGRPKGTRNKKNVIAQEFEKEASEVARVVMKAALKGDMTAANMVLQRLSPPLRARAEKVMFELTPDAPLTEQAQQILTAVAAGDIDPETGKLLIDAISAFAGLKQVDDLEARLIALEGRK